MNAPRPSRSMPLREFFERFYVPAKKSKHPQAYYDYSIVWLGRAIGRPPRVWHLNEANIEAAQKAIADEGYSQSRIEQIKYALGRLWRYAYELGLVDDRPRRTAPVQERAKPDYGPPPAGSLTAYYRDVFRPKLRAKSRKRRNTYDLAVRRFIAFCDGHTPIEEIDNGMIDAFVEWLQQGGVCHGQMLQERDAVKTVVLDARPVDQNGEPPISPLRPFGWKRKEELPEPAPGSVREFFWRVYRPQRLLGCEERTLVHYEIALRRLYLWRSGDLPLAELNDANASAFFQHLLDEGAKPVTVNRYRGHLFAIWNLAFEQGLLERPPRIKKLRTHLEEPDAWSLDEIRRILDAAARFQPHWSKPGFHAGRFWRALLLVCWYTALRRGSLLKLRRQDVNLDAAELYVPADKMKNKRGKRFKLGPDAVEAIRRLHEGAEEEALFPWPYGIGSLGDHFRRILDAAGVPPSHRNNGHFHKLRRTCASFAAANGGMSAAIALLGHSSEYVTLRYLDPRMLPGNDATKLLPPLNLSPAAPEGNGHDRQEPAEDCKNFLQSSDNNAPADDPLSDAESLLGEGRAALAAMSARLALERRIREIARQEKLTSPKHRLAGLIKKLARRGRLDEEAAHRTLDLLAIGNAAAHGRPVDHDDVEQFVEALRRLFPAGPSTEAA